MCGICGDLGLQKGCPECSKEPQRKKTNNQQQSEKLKQLKALWDTSVFFAEKPNLLGTQIVLDYTRALTEVINYIKEHGVLDRSIMVIAPANYGKEIFAETALYYTEIAGLKVVPILDLDEYCRLLQLSKSSTPLYRVKGILYEDFLEADLAIVTIPLVLTSRESASSIADILKKRGRHKKATIIISRFTISQINSYDKRMPLTDFLNPNINDNLYKVPAIISC